MKKFLEKRNKKKIYKNEKKFGDKREEVKTFGITEHEENIDFNPIPSSFFVASTDLENDSELKNMLNLAKQKAVKESAAV